MDLENQDVNSGATDSVDTAQEHSTSDNTSPTNTQAEVAQTLAELDRMEKFRFKGREYTPKDLEKAMWRQRDYTEKTTALAKERETLEGERKFYENLYADLNIVKNHPHLAQAFMKEYPEKFHVYLRNLFETPKQGPTQPQQAMQSQSGQKPDLELLARLNKMEGFIAEQETVKNLSFIDKQVESMSKKYPDALPDLALAKVHDGYLSGQKVDEVAFEKAFKESDAQMKHILKTRYSATIKKQTEANKKGKDVQAGGGTPGLAPKKFKNIGEVTKYAVSRFSGQ